MNWKKWNNKQNHLTPWIKKRMHCEYWLTCDVWLILNIFFNQEKEIYWQQVYLFKCLCFLYTLIWTALMPVIKTSCAAVMAKHRFLCTHVLSEFNDLKKVPNMFLLTLINHIFYKGKLFNYFMKYSNLKSYRLTVGKKKHWWL